MKHGFGVIELFYGTPWDWQDRHSYAAFLKECGYKFYIYAPKADGRLRKSWQHQFTSEEMKTFMSLRQTFAKHGLKFGMVLSPYGLHENLDQGNLKILRDKVRSLDELELDYLGLFFDDMHGSPEIAAKQLEIAENVRTSTEATVIFAPTYYSSDPLLDMFFGQRPDRYLETIGKDLNPAVEVLWTGEQVISPNITADHLLQMGKLLQRKPFICDNLFANDGPVFCNFLKLHPGTGRAHDVFSQASGWSLNPMNQSNLSKIVLLAFAQYSIQNHDLTESFTQAVHRFCPGPTADLILSNGKSFFETGLSEMTDEQKDQMRTLLTRHAGPVENEILGWLDGKYTVGFEVLTD